MNFKLLTYLSGIFLFFAVFTLIVIRIEKKFFAFVKTYWFYKRSVFSYLSTFFFLVGMGFLLTSLLDLRGAEEKIKVEAPTTRTIILIDTSASMLAEDVKPNRLQKAVLIAKHFSRKAAGQQLSIVAFSEIQKKVVPFTNDLDLIDARLDSLKTLRNHNGSSALSVAIQESIQYFRETDSEPRGNILVLTDGEETAEKIDLKIPKDIRVALVGVGTEQGGRIPLDDGRGFRFGYKKDAGKDVITRLHEGFFKAVANDLPSAKYWLANTYSLPSEEVINFFLIEKNKKENKQDMVVRPVLMELLVVPAVVLILLSYLFKSIRVFTLGLLVVLSPVRAQEKGPELSPEVISRMNELQKGELNQIEKLKLADDLYRSGAKDEALELYDENLTGKISNQIPPEAYMNFGTALLEKGEVERSLELYRTLSDSMDKSEGSEKLRKMMNTNVVSFFKQQEQKKKDQQKKDQEKNQDQKKNDQNDESSQGQQNKDRNKDGSGKQKNNDQKNGQNDQNKDAQKDQQNKDKKEKDQDKKDEDENQDQSDQKKDDQGKKKKMPPQKIPAKLKQLMSDDRQLQMKMIENGTRDLNRKKSRKSKDW